MKIKKLKNSLTERFYILKLKVSYIAYFSDFWKDKEFFNKKGFCIDTGDIDKAKHFKTIEEAKIFIRSNNLFGYEIIQIEK